MARKMKFDFTDVESFVKCEEGRHVVRLMEIEETTASTGNPMLAAKFEVVKGESTGAILYDNFVLTDKALWKFKSYLEVVGVKADGRVALDLDKLEGKKCEVEVTHEEYNGSMKARIADYKKIKIEADPEDDYEDEDEDIEDDEEEEETPPPKKKPKKKEEKKKPKKKQPEPEEEDEDEDWEEE